MVVEPRIQEQQCGFRPGRGTTDQLFFLQQVIETTWEFVQPVYASFVDLEKAYDQVPRDLLWLALHEYGNDGQLLAAIQSLYSECRSCIRLDGRKSGWFGVNVGLRQGCVLSPLLSLVFMDRISRRSSSSEGLKVGNVELKSTFCR